MSLSSVRLFLRLADSQRILIAGAGGGFDVFAGLPLYFALRAMGKEAHLANLTFSNTTLADAERLAPPLARVTPESRVVAKYFPEKYLAEWFENRGEKVPIWCFDKTGVRPLAEAYQRLVEHLDIDAIVLVDGGTDALMRGNESGLGTPAEDVASIAAARQTACQVQLLTCIGFGVDSFHGVCHAHFLESVAALVKAGAFLGTFSLLEETEEFSLYREATEFTIEQMSHHPSIVNTSILSAVEGDYGDVHRNHRTAGSELWINPLMSIYWSFELAAVAERNLYLHRLLDTKSMSEIQHVLRGFRANFGKPRPWRAIPV